MELAPGVGRVVDAVGAQAHLEAQVGVVAQVGGDAHDVLAGDEDGELAAVDDHLLDDVGDFEAVCSDELLEDVDGLVEPAAVGPDRVAGHVG